MAAAWRDAAGRETLFFLCEMNDWPRNVVLVDQARAWRPALSGILDFGWFARPLIEREISGRSAAYHPALRFVLPHHNGLRRPGCCGWGCPFTDNIGGRNLLRRRVRRF